MWYNGLGTCLVRAQFPKGTHELQVSLLQVWAVTLPAVPPCEVLVGYSLGWCAIAIGR